MPKYFSDERPLPFDLVVLKPSEITAEVLSKLFAKQNSYSICVTFKGFEKTCLGYIVHAKKQANKYELLNIVKEVQFVVSNEQELASVLKHISGIEYSQKVQDKFHSVRNDIGSSLSNRLEQE